MSRKLRSIAILISLLGGVLLGHQRYGQLGDGSTVGSVTSTPVPVAGGLTFTALSADANGAHACGVTKGFSYCWGGSWFGQLGNGSTQNSSIPVRISSP